MKECALDLNSGNHWQEHLCLINLEETRPPAGIKSSFKYYRCQICGKMFFKTFAGNYYRYPKLKTGCC